MINTSEQSTLLAKIHSLNKEIEELKKERDASIEKGKGLAYGCPSRLRSTES